MSYFDARGQAHTGDLTQSRVRLLRGGGVDTVLVAGSDTVSFVPNHTHKSITPFWVRKKQSILRLTAYIIIRTSFQQYRLLLTVLSLE